VNAKTVQSPVQPLFNQDLEKPEPPASVKRFREQVLSSDAILFACPENNFSVSAALKNAIDWGSRSPNVFDGKAAAIVGAGGGAGSGRAHYHLRQIGVYVNLLFINRPELQIQAFSPPAKFNADGDLIDQDLVARLRQVVEALVAWALKIKA